MNISLKRFHTFKNFSTIGGQACIFPPFLPCVLPQKMVKWVYLDSDFRLKSYRQHKNNYPDLHHSQGGMKFATQISPLLNYLSSSNKLKIPNFELQSFNECCDELLPFQQQSAFLLHRLNIHILDILFLLGACFLCHWA